MALSLIARSTIRDRRYKRRSRCVGFDRRRTRACSFQIITISRAIKFADKSLIKSDHFCCPEIGGTKKPGLAPSGTCNLRTERWCERMKQQASNGDWMGSMTDKLFNDLAS